MRKNFNIIVCFAIAVIGLSGQVRPRAGEPPVPKYLGGDIRVILDPVFSPASLGELSFYSDVIVLGHVIGILPGRIPDSQRPSSVETDAKFSVDQVLKGALSQQATLIIAERGGDAGGSRVIVVDNDQVAVGQKYVLFLKADKRSGLPSIDGLPRFKVSGIFSGKFRVDDAGNVFPSKRATGDLHLQAGAPLAGFLDSVTAAMKAQ